MSEQPNFIFHFFKELWRQRNALIILYSSLLLVDVLLTTIIDGKKKKLLNPRTRKYFKTKVSFLGVVTIALLVDIFITILSTEYGMEDISTKHYAIVTTNVFLCYSFTEFRHIFRAMQQLGVTLPRFLTMKIEDIIKIDDFKCLDEENPPKTEAAPQKQKQKKGK